MCVCARVCVCVFSVGHPFLGCGMHNLVSTLFMEIGWVGTTVHLGVGVEGALYAILHNR